MKKVKNLKSKITKRDMFGIAILFTLALIMIIGLEWGFEGIFFWLFFVSLFYWKIDSRVSIGLALVGLVSIMLLLALHGFEIAPDLEWGGNIITMHLDVFAEVVAVWVYFFLVIGVAKQIYEYRYELKNEDEKIEKNSK